VESEVVGQVNRVLGQEVRCPLCRVGAGPDGRCPDCGQDLAPLSYLRSRAALLYNRALELIRSGDDERAAHQLEAALAEDDTLVDAWVVLGKLRARAGRRDEARHAFGSALALQADHPGARTALDALAPRRRWWPALVAAGVAAAVVVLVVAWPRAAPVAVTEAPVGFLAVTARGDAVELAGPVPDEPTRAGFTAAARAAAGSRTVVDSLVVDPSSAVQPGLDATDVGRIVGALGSERGVVMSGTHLVLSGTVPDEPARASAVAALRAAVPGSEVDDRMGIGTVDDGTTRLQAAVAAVQSVGPILFPAGQGQLGPRGSATVRSIARLLVGVEGVTIQVDGYAAPPAGPGVQEISDQRGRAVRDALVAAGVDPASIVATGRGAAAPRPTAAASRRVEISVRPA
jgi:outer membrane protein OmpA-like peptidoglycan-associated protein